MAGRTATTTGAAAKRCCSPSTAATPKTVGACGNGIRRPVVAFPALGPRGDGVLQSGVFPGEVSRWVVHHVPRLVESRAAPQAGYKVMFVPIARGVATGQPEVFADGFAGATSHRRAPRSGDGRGGGPRWIAIP